MKTDREIVVEAIMLKAAEWVQKHGPATAAKIAEGIGTTTGRLVNAIYASNVLCTVGVTTQKYKQGAKRGLYGLVVESGYKKPAPAPAAPGSTSFVCSRLGRTVELMACVEDYTDATARYRSSPCCQCRTGATHRARFAGCKS